MKIYYFFPTNFFQIPGIQGVEIYLGFYHQYPHSLSSPSPPWLFVLSPSPPSRSVPSPVVLVQMERQAGLVAQLKKWLDFCGEYCGARGFILYFFISESKNKYIFVFYIHCLTIWNYIISILIYSLIMIIFYIYSFISFFILLEWLFYDQFSYYLKFIILLYKIIDFFIALSD